MSFIQGSLLAHPSMVAWRNRLRGNAFFRGLYRAWAGNESYEERFGRGLLANVANGDVVWDIGANVGLYSEKFLERGARAVVCFEPAPDAIRALTERFAAVARERVRIVPAALSNARGTASFLADGASPVNKLSDAGGAGTIDVPVLRGDEALVEHALPLPDVIKVDVEGFEAEVIEGLDGVFERAPVRAVFIEVHFSLLHQRGLDAAPAAIVRRLEQRNFRVSWLDASHLQAMRAH